MKLTLLCTLVLLLSQTSRSQVDTIHLKNPSFEDIPRHSQGVRDWIDCGRNFIGESAPDVQPFIGNVSWAQKLQAIDGQTYLGLVVRDNDTYERVGQKLSHPLEADQCYTFSIHLSTSRNYYSHSQTTKQRANFIEPAVFKIYAGKDSCDRQELLAVSDLVTNNEWDRYDFTFRPKGDYLFLMLEAHHRTPCLIPYNGNILVDHASPIIKTTCPEDIIASTEDAKPGSDPEEQSVQVTKPTKVVPAVATAPVVELPKKKRPYIPPPERPILTDLQRDKLVSGQTVRIDRLFFAADTATIDEQSIPVLEEIAYFLSVNEDIHVEVGGHTNNQPATEFCDSLSTRRARSVAEYLYSRGIDTSQVAYKGYGKREPIATNKTSWGRQQNQRVEIRILSMGE